MFSKYNKTSHSKTTHSNTDYDINLVRTTFENLVSLLRHDKYRYGVDSITLGNTLNDIFRYVSGDYDSKIRLPAPITDLDDKYGLMWPEGARVYSRAPSDTSRTSRRSNRSRNLSSRYTSGYTDPLTLNRAMSVTSSQFSSKYVGFVEEKNDGYNYYHAAASPVQRRKSNTMPGSNTIAVNGTVMKPTPSLEKLFAKSTINDNDDDDDDDDKPQYDRRDRPPVTTNRPQNTNINFNPMPDPIDVSRSRRSKVNFVENE